MLDPHELSNIIEPPALKAVQLKGQLGFDIPAAPRARRKLTSVKSKQDPSWTVFRHILEWMRERRS